MNTRVLMALLYKHGVKVMFGTHRFFQISAGIKMFYVKFLRNTQKCYKLGDETTLVGVISRFLLCCSPSAQSQEQLGISYLPHKPRWQSCSNLDSEGRIGMATSTRNSLRPTIPRRIGSTKNLGSTVETSPDYIFAPRSRLLAAAPPRPEGSLLGDQRLMGSPAHFLTPRSVFTHRFFF